MIAETSKPTDPDEGQPGTYEDTAPPDEGLTPLPQDLAPAKKPRGKAAAADAQSAIPREGERGQIPSIGRIVHFMIPAAMHGGAKRVHRPAIVSNVRNEKKGLIDLHVFVTKEDYPANFHPGPLMVADKVTYSEAEEDGTWHWPERV